MNKSIKSPSILSSKRSSYKSMASHIILTNPFSNSYSSSTKMKIQQKNSNTCQKTLLKV